MNIKRSIKTVLIGLLLVPMLVLGSTLFTPFTTSATAATCISPLVNATADDTMCVALSCKDLKGAALGACASKGTGQVTDLFGTGGVFQTITNTALFIIGALSVIMLIYGGIRYTISAGDAKQVEAAKNTIMYAIIGIVVALLAYAIVNFVLGTLIKL